MKHSELRVGREYAYRHTAYNDPARVVVTTLSVTKETGPYHRLRTVPAVGIRVLSEGLYNLTGKEIVVLARSIVDPWSEYAAEKQAKDRMEEAWKAEQEQQKRNRAAALERVENMFIENGVEVPDLTDWGSGGRHLVDIEELATALDNLIAAAYGKGVADVSG